jgi:hypothetical protein
MRPKAVRGAIAVKENLPCQIKNQKTGKVNASIANIRIDNRSPMGAAVFQWSMPAVAGW